MKQILKKNYNENEPVNTYWLRFDVIASFWGFHMRETSDKVMRFSFWERRVKELLGFCVEITDYYVLKREIISLIYKKVVPFTTVENKNRGDIQSQSHYYHDKWQIVGDEIRTILLHVHFTTVVTYDRCDMSFSKYKKSAQK